VRQEGLHIVAHPEGDPRDKPIIVHISVAPQAAQLPSSIIARHMQTCLSPGSPCRVQMPLLKEGRFLILCLGERWSVHTGPSTGPGALRGHGRAKGNIYCTTARAAHRIRGACGFGDVGPCRGAAFRAKIIPIELYSKSAKRVQRSLQEIQGGNNATIADGGGLLEPLNHLTVSPARLPAVHVRRRIGKLPACFTASSRYGDRCRCCQHFCTRSSNALPPSKRCWHASQ